MGDRRMEDTRDDQLRAALTLRSVNVVKPDLDGLFHLSRRDFLRDLPRPEPDLRDLPPVIQLDRVERHVNVRCRLDTTTTDAMVSNNDTNGQEVRLTFSIPSTHVVPTDAHGVNPL